MNPLRLLLALALFSPLLAAAQETPVPVRIRFLFLDENPGNYFVKQGADYKSLGSKPYVISSEFEFAPGSRLQLFRQQSSPQTGESTRTMVVNLTVAASPLQALAVIAPSATVAADGSRSYQSRFYDTSPARTPARSIRILNLSPATMAARFGAEEIQVPPGEDKVITPTPDKRSRIRTYVASQGSGEWRMIFNSFLSLGQYTRMTGIVVYSPSGLRHTYTKEELATLGPPKPGYFWLSFTEDTPPPAS